VTLAGGPARTPAQRASRAHRRVTALLVLLAGWVALAVSGATPALAHATVVGSDPADGARLSAAPAQVTMIFSESVSIGPGFLHVTDGKGEQVSLGDATADGSRVSVPLRAGLGDGSYLVSYRVVSADSHPVGGAFSFVVGDGPLASATGTATGGPADRAVRWLFAAARFASFAGVVLLGGLVFVMSCWPAGRESARAGRVIWTGWVAAAGGAVLAVLLQGPYVAGTGLVDAVDLGLLRTTLDSTYGRMLCGRLVLLGALAFLAVRLLRDQDGQQEPTRSRDEDLAAVCGLGVLATYGGTGHAVAGSGPMAALLSDTTHLAAAAVWIGGLAVLLTCLLPSRRTEELAAALPRFSRIALGSVAVLAVTGTYQGWREVAPLPALWSTEYGRLLLVKIAGFVLLVGLGNLGRLAVRRRYRTPVACALSAQDVAEADLDGAEEDQLLRRLRTSVGVEVVIAAAVLAATAVLVSTAPARATYSKPVETTVQLAFGGSAALSITPARAGANTVSVTVLDPQRRPVDAAQVSMTAALPAEQIGPLPVRLDRTGTGRYETSAAPLPRPGTWELVLRVQKSEFDRDVAQVDVPVT
jgi:copper transport protein